MKKYACNICAYIYDPEKGDPDSGIAPGTAFEDIPDDWVCPDCGVGKDDFSEVEDQCHDMKGVFLIKNSFFVTWYVEQILNTLS